MINEDLDFYYMGLALKEAEIAYREGEVPIGCVIVIGDKVFKSHNKKEHNFDPTAHAEINAIRKACKALKIKHLSEATMYVTIEPCLMCASSINEARISRLVYGAREEKFGAIASKINIYDLYRSNHTVSVTSGVRELEAKKLIQDFFASKRKH